MTIHKRASESARCAVTPEISERLAQPYCAIAARCRRDELGTKVPALLDELLAWLERHGVTPVGQQLVRYLVVDYNTGNLNIEVGLLVESDKRPVSPRIHWSETPAGRYATVVHAGPYVSLVDTTAELLAWARTNRIGLDVEENEKVAHWGCRIELYLVAPPRESRPERWRTEISILLSDAADTGPTFDQPRNATRKETP
jgi:effector-binding domain-containing protein